MTSHLLNAFASDDPERFAFLLGTSENTADTLLVLDSIPSKKGAEVVACMSSDTADRLLPTLADERLAKWLKAANFESGRRLLTRVSPERSAHLIELVDDRSKRRQLKRLVGFPPGSIGTLVQVTMLALPRNTAYPEISARIQAHQASADEPVAVLDEQGGVMGVLDFRSFIAAQDEAATAGEFCIPMQAVFADAPLSSLTEPEHWEHQSSLPVVDYDHKPVGFVTRAAVDAATRTVAPRSYYLEAAGELTTRFWQLLSYLLVLMLDRRRQP